METNQKTDIILAAIGAAGPADDADWLSKVTDLAAQITVMTSEQSSLSKHIDSVATAKVFRGSVLGVVKEQSSTRGIITLKTGSIQTDPKTKLPVARKDATSGGELPLGQEQVRTDRMDGPLGLAMGRRVRGLIGHNVLVWVKVEEYNGGQGKVRVLVHVEDQGISDDADAAAALMGVQQRESAKAA